MYYIETIKARVLPLALEYWAILQEAFTDINTYIDAQLESEHKTNMILAGIAATPFAGVGLFMLVLMLSS